MDYVSDIQWQVEPINGTQSSCLLPLLESEPPSAATVDFQSFRFVPSGLRNPPVPSLA